MSDISFNNIPTTIRTPGIYTEIDNSRALQGLTANPHKVLILGQMTSGSVAAATLQRITTATVADGYFGQDSVLGRMCRAFKNANPNTDLYAMALNSAGGVQASGGIKFSIALSHNSGVVSTTGETVNLMVAGIACPFTLTNAWSVTDVNSAAAAAINANAYMPVSASTTSASALVLTAIQDGTLGNGIDIRFNYFDGQSDPTCFGDSAAITAMSDGSADPDYDAAWSIIENETFQYIVAPWNDNTNMTALDTELETRFGPLTDKQGIAITAKAGTAAALATWGDGKNSAFVTAMGTYKSPTPAEEWAAVYAALLSYNLNVDPARPLHTLVLKGLLPPKNEDLFTRTERDLLLWDGISTFVVNSSGYPAIERAITMYQENATGAADASYLNVNTMATLAEIRYQYNVRMSNRFLVPRFKLADDTYPVQPGQKIATPKTVKQEIVALFVELRDAGLVENLEDFIDNLIVQRNSVDKDRVDVLLPPDLVNQFRILASKIQFIL